MRSPLEKSQRVLFIIVACILAEVAIAWCIWGPLSTGVVVGAGMLLGCLSFIPTFLAEDTELITERYRYLCGEFPYVANRKLGFRGFMDRSRQVVALYSGRLILINAKVAKEVPWEVFTSDGAGHLLRLRRYGPPRVLALTDVESLHVHRSRVFNKSITFDGRTGRSSFRFKLSGEDGEAMLEPLRKLLGDRLSVSSDAPDAIHRNRIWGMVAICIALDVAAALTVWLAPAEGEGRGLYELVGIVRDRLGSWGSTGLLALGLLFLNWMLLFIAAHDPTHGGPDSEV